MNTIKKISILLVLLLAIFTSAENECFSLFVNSHKHMDHPTNSATSANTVLSHADHLDDHQSLEIIRCVFNQEKTLSEKVLKSESFHPRNLFSRIWQPPKVS